MKFDDVTIELGEFGRYQKRLYLIVIVPYIFCALQLMSSVFTLAIPNHRCRVPSLDDDTYEVKDVNHSLLINGSIPWEEDGTEGPVYSPCYVYRTSSSTVYGNFGIPTNAPKEECDSWVYDKSVFQSTFVSQMDLICGVEWNRANVNMILIAGQLVGAVGLGIIADAFGRKSAFILSVFLHVCAGLASAFAPDYGSFLAFRFIAGMANIGIVMSCFVIGMEMVGPSKRVLAGVAINLSWCIGLFLLVLVAYFIRNWNILYIIISAPAALLFSYFWLIPESPRWLISRGKFDSANKIIQKAAKVNAVTLQENIIDKITEGKGERVSVVKMFTNPRLVIRTLILFFNWGVVGVVYFGLGLNVGNLDGDIYVNFLINSAVELAAYVLCLFTLDRVGRKVLHAVTMILGGVACLCTIFTVIYADKSLKWVTLVLAHVGKFGISAAFAVIFIRSAELFPTIVRNSGMGSSSIFANVGGMVSPYIADLGKLVEGPFGTALPLIIFGGLSVAAGLLSLLLPETMGKAFPETIEDAERMTLAVTRPRRSTFATMPLRETRREHLQSCRTISQTRLNVSLLNHK